MKKASRLCYITQHPIALGVGLAAVPSEGIAATIARISGRLRFAPMLLLSLPFIGRRHLLTTCSIIGVQVHDARLAAALRVHGIPHLLTLNTRDFKRFGITAIDPAQVGGAPSTSP